MDERIDSRIDIHSSLIFSIERNIRHGHLIADTACVDPRSELGDDVEVGPYCVIGPDVKIGRGTRLIAHACIQGQTTLGEETSSIPSRSSVASPRTSRSEAARPASRSATTT